MSATGEEEPITTAEEPVEESAVAEEVREGVDEEAAPEEEEEVAEHLKDAVEGSFRLKRYLTQDEADASGAKKARTGPNPIKMKQLLVKWHSTNDEVVKHVVEQTTDEEIDTLLKSHCPIDPYNESRSPADFAAKYVAELRERKLSTPNGGKLDTIATFRARWKLPLDQDASLRALPHKDLRYVFDNYDGSVPLEDVINEAASYEQDTADDVTINALPNGEGAFTMSRFSRLELIDPLADSAVFGDANLTFSLRLARHRKALGHVGRVIATTFEELETLRERYKEIDESIQTLEEHYAEVYHGVDCTRIAVDPRFEGLEGSLGAVYYNFPHSGSVGGFFDGHPIVNWRHENLMRLFFRALRFFVKPGGVVKVSSNSKALGVRYSYIVGSAIQNEFKHTETMPFMEWHLHRYGRSYGDKRDAHRRPDAVNNQSYNAQQADADMVYCFSYQPSGETLPPQEVRFPPTLKTLMACTDGPFKHAFGEMKKKKAEELHKRFVTEVSGTHVG
eukprot:TRINITY_DN63424_c0_g1_i1.p1 TRINITY_DN63424_c0_g1~~TRINITY_DN63424_c0_g1_i1.p1  ORF type:complete len:506 (-),score=108.43 TRINITY_DN63424_c0_g1_i1:155-1672(-)